MIKSVTFAAVNLGGLLHTWLGDWNHLYLDMKVWAFIDNDTRFAVGGDFILLILFY